MPELPEVETVCRGLAQFAEGRSIAEASLRRKDLRFPLPQNMAARLTGGTIRQIRRRAKYILVDIDCAPDTQLVWLTHLGMSGRFTVLPTQGKRQKPGRFKHPIAGAAGDGTDKHDHVLIRLDDGTRLVYTDPRRFGYMDLMAAAAVADNPHLRHLGPEPLGNQFDAAILHEKLAGRRTPIKNALLDQHIVAGLGNIYVCEALYRAGISPRRLATNVGPQRLSRLVPAIRDVLTAAIEAGGSSLRDFAGAQGSAGYFQHNFDVYDRAGASCSTPSCNATIKRIVQSGRSSFYCPACQK